MAKKLSAFFGVADRHKQVADAAQRIIAILEEFPELEEEFAESVLKSREGRGTNGHPVIQGARPRVTVPAPAALIGISNVDRLVKFFVDNDNKPVATPAIHKAVGLSKIEVSNVLWSAKAKRIFHKENSADNGKIKLWRLKDDEFSAQKHL